jgi:hypothetical protein
MDAVFDRYFQTRLANSAIFPSIQKSWSNALIQLIIQTAQGWRSDAIYFLASNISSMVLQPYARAAGIRSVHQLLNSEAWDAIQRDVEAIAGLANEVAVERDRDYVSATSVAVALGRLAPSLRTTALHIWGP